MRNHRRDFVTGVLATALGAAGATRAQTTAGARQPKPGSKPAVNPNAPPPPGFYDFSGVSGPGKPAQAYSEHGGWRSGSTGVAYSGPDPQAFKPLKWEDYATGAAVTSGLLPPIRPLIEAHVRDTVITLGGDGNYYMTGSTGDNIWAFNDGVELWRSPDLKSWDYLGVVWSIEKDGGWEKRWRGMHDLPTRAIWAPEIHYVGGVYAIALSMAPGGLSILKSTTGKAEGPYAHAFSPDKPIMNGIDGTLFEDDDGSVYYTYGGARRLYKLKADWSGFEGEPHEIKFDEDHDPAHHGPRCPNNNFDDIGREGAVLFKAEGRYYLGAADWPQGRYSTMLVVSDSLFGPYHKRHESVPCGGGTGFFRDKQGAWWSTFFGNDQQSPFLEKPAIVRVAFDAEGRVGVDRAFYKMTS
jgi:hypothetical protein